MAEMCYIAARGMGWGGTKEEDDQVYISVQFTAVGLSGWSRSQGTAGRSGRQAGIQTLSRDIMHVWEEL